MVVAWLVIMAAIIECLLDSELYSVPDTLTIAPPDTVVSILQLWKLKLWKFKRFTQGHTNW